MTDIRNKDRILEAIDQLRRRKARPDIDRICNFVFRRFGVDCKETLGDLQRLVDAEIVIKVEYKGNTSYRNAAKWSKYAMYKNRELRNSTGSTEIHNILSRAFASLLVEDPDYLDIGVPRTELERFMLQDDPLTDLTEIELILTKETSSGFLVKLKNGNYSLADHPVPSTSPKSTSPISSNAITVQGSFSVSPAEKTVRFKSTSPQKDKKPKLELPSPSVITTSTTVTTSASTTSVTSSSTGNMTKTKSASKSTPKPTSAPAATNGKGTELGAINVGGYRVGVRRKTAKKVFDPSDNYTPTRKRGRPAGSGNSSKKDAQPSGGTCCLCSSTTGNTRKTNTDKLIQCRDCSNRAHLSCIAGKCGGKEKPQSGNWVCHGCKLCAFCFETSENEAMAVCAKCGDAYHLTCHNPPITEEKWIHKWLCSCCDIRKGTSKSSSKAAAATPPVVFAVPAPPPPLPPPPPPPPPPVTTAPGPSSAAAPATSASTVTPPCGVKLRKALLNDKFFQIHIPQEKTPDAKDWTVDEVCKYLQEHNCAAQSEAFRHHEIDGRSLLLLTRHDVLYELGLKMGPAVKVLHFVQLLQTRDIRKVFPFNEILSYPGVCE